MKKIISLIFCLIIILSIMLSTLINTNATSKTLDYNFAKSDRGFAEGTISLAASSGTYWLYWADNAKALDGYKEIAKLTFNSPAIMEHKMFERTAIPVGATKLIAIKSTTEPEDKTVVSADDIYEIPAEKRLSFKSSDKRYRFASYSDVHIDSVKKNYKYDEEHWRRALDTAAKRDTEFIVMSGDYINNNVNFEGISPSEWRIYQRVLAESDYCNPVYEAIGNHEIRQDTVSGMSEFINGTGLEGDNSSSSTGYFEKTLHGDHFIFMSLEKGFRPSKKASQFSDAQLNWLEGLLKKYSGDGHNIYIIEHALFYKYGAGDRIDAEPYYSLPLYDPLESTQRFKSLLQEYKDTIFLSGHTHIAFEYQYNFSDNLGTSGQMIHNSSIGGVRHIIDGALNSSYKEDEIEGYIVDVYNDAILFNGANLYYDQYDPNCCYIIKPSKFFTGYNSATEDEVSESTEETQTEEIDEALFKTGDVNLDGKISISDATQIQHYLARIAKLNAAQYNNADANSDGKVDINDTTTIQKYLANIIPSLGTDKQSQTDREELKKNIKNNLELYYRYSSYDSYQALKKAYRNDADTKTLNNLNLNLLAVVDKSNIDKEESMTVYFENTNDWKEVYAYNWGSDGKVKAMPGTKMTYVEKNAEGKSIYKYTIPDKKYNKFLFTDGTNKTQNITFYSGDICYYIYDSTSSLKVKGYKYSK